MVGIADKINGYRGGNACASTIKQEDNHQTARIIQWLGGERAGMCLQCEHVILSLLLLNEITSY